MTDLDVHIRKLLAVLDVEMDAARQELDERRATETGIISGLAKDDTLPHPVYGFLHAYMTPITKKQEERLQGLY